MLRKTITLCAVIWLIVSCAFPAFAQAFDPERRGSISVTLTEGRDQHPIEGAELSVYYVATVGMNSGGKLSYVYTSLFENSGFDLSDLALSQKLENFVSGHDVSSLAITTDGEGRAVCEDLRPGLYFIRQSGTVEGFAPCSPFVVTLPGITEDGYVYDINASPKIQAATLTSITIKKVWNTDASTQATDSVRVELLHNSKVVQTAVLNAENHWQVTYTDMPESDAYSIREVDVPKGFTATYSQQGYVFTVTNTATLIQTGQLVWPIPLLALCGMVLIAVGTVLLHKGKHHV